MTITTHNLHKYVQGAKYNHAYEQLEIYTDIRGYKITFSVIPLPIEPNVRLNNLNSLLNIGLTKQDIIQGMELCSLLKNTL